MFGSGICTGRCVTNLRFQFLGTRGEYFPGSTWGKFNFSFIRLIMEGCEIRTRDLKLIFFRRRDLLGL